MQPEPPAIDTLALPWPAALALPADEVLTRRLRRAAEQHRMAVFHGHPLVRCEAASAVGQCLASFGAAGEAALWFQAALVDARRLPHSPDLQADLLAALAELACTAAEALESADPGLQQAAGAEQQARESAHAHAEAAVDAALEASDTTWRIRLLLRMAELLERNGDFDDAVALHRRVLDLQNPPRRSRGSGPRASGPQQRM